MHLQDVIAPEVINLKCTPFQYLYGLQLLNHVLYNYKKIGIKKKRLLHLFYKYLQKEPVKFYSFLLDT